MGLQRNFKNKNNNLCMFAKKALLKTYGTVGDSILIY